MAKFFDSFSRKDVKKISDHGRKLTLPEGWSPISEGTGADKAYIIVEGTVSVRKNGEEIAQLGEGDIMGETAIVGHSLRTASIVALTPLQVIHLTAEAVNELCDEMPAFKKAIDEVQAARE